MFRRWNTIIPRTEEEEPRINEEITTPKVLLVDDNNVKVGEVAIAEALKLSEERMLDLVEVAPQAKPPVCKIMDYSKYRYQLQKKEKDARKKQKGQVLKEIKMRPKIDEHDYDFKVKAIKNFLEDGHRVKVSVFFRGREMSFLSKGEEVLKKVMDECDEFGKCESSPKMEGRYMRIMLTPVSQTKPKRPSESEGKPEKKTKPAAPAASNAEA